MAKTGLDRILKPSGNGDEFGKGTVGSEAEVEKEVGKEQQLVYGGGHFETEKAGLVDGISARSDLDPADAEPVYNYDIDPLTGSAPERKTGRVNNETVKGKGKSFEMGEM